MFFQVKKNSGCSITWIPDKSGICVLLQQRKTDCVKLVLYTVDDVGIKKVVLDSLWSRRFVTMNSKACLKAATQKEDHNWFSRPIIA